MVSPTKIIVTLEKKYVDELDFLDKKIYLDPTYQPEWNAFKYGNVHSIPKRNDFVSNDFVYNVEIGDKLYINYGVIIDESNMIEHDREEYWLVDYFQALAVARDGKIFPVGEHILIEPIEEEVTHEFLIIPEMSKKRITKTGNVFASNDPAIPVGSKVMFEERGMFENEIEGKKLFVMFNSNILGILNEKATH
jgi:co-chaperonin GroES (HSP10)